MLGKDVRAVNVRNFRLDASVLSTPPKTEHLPLLSCLSSQHFVLKKNILTVQQITTFIHRGQ